MKIALVARASPGQISGSSRVVERLADGLAARGHDLRRFAPDPTPLPAGDRATALDAIRSRMAIQHHALDQLWREWRPDVVHIEFADDFGHVARQVAHSCALPITTRFHRLHALAPTAERSGLLAQILGFHRDSAATVAQSREQEGWLRGHGVANAETIENGVDLRRFHPQRRSPRLRTAWGAGDTDPVLLWVGRLLPDKDPELYAAAADAARAMAPTARAVVVGDGPEREALRARLPWAIFTGSLGDDELAAAYASADLLLFTSPPEGIDGWGNVVTEAMAAGLAPLAYAFGAAGACVADGVSGRLVASGRRAEYIAAAAELAVSPTRLRELGAAARAAVTERTWAASVERYDELLTRIARVAR